MIFRITFATLVIMTLIQFDGAFANAEDDTPTAPADEAVASADSTGQNISQVKTADAVGGEGVAHTFDANYFGVLFGPSLNNSTSFQPSPDGTPDTDKPVLVKNYLSLSYNFTDTIAVSPTAYFWYQPVLGQDITMKDPFVRVSDSQIIHTEHLNLYSDLRFYIPVTSASRQADLRSGIQTFQVLTYEIPESRFTIGANGSVRMNIYGSQGTGEDLELYFAPTAYYDLSHDVALTLLYEVGTSHYYGTDTFDFVSDGTDIEPGVSWNITPRVMVNPYLNFPLGPQASLKATSIGALVSLQLI